MGKRLQIQIKKVLEGKELTVFEIMERLKQDDRRKMSFTSNSVAQTLTKKPQFVKCGYNPKKQVAIWTTRSE